MISFSFFLASYKVLRRSINLKRQDAMEKCIGTNEARFGYKRKRCYKHTKPEG